MGFFTVANAQDVSRIVAPNGEDWLEIKADFSKSDVNKLMLAAPRSGEDLKVSLDFVDRFFEIAVMGWSMVDEKGEAVKPSLTVYKQLSNEPAKWIDEQLGKALDELLGREVEEEGKEPSS
jgi:hypothetical protein